MYRHLENATALLEEYQKKPGVRSRLLSPEEYNMLLQHQGGVCAVCGRKSRERLVIDHDHSSGRVRGLLCNPCNLGLGLFKDDQKRFLAAVEYLRTRKTDADRDGA